jgi:bifunctional non-homologous end joining protein LigD
VLKRLPFIAPSAPVLKKRPPHGSDWLHEVKHDGWRAQLHVDGDRATVYSRNGRDLSRRFRSICNALSELHVRSIIIDVELVACDDTGKPDFRALISGGWHGVCAWCFDLMHLNGRDLRPLPLDERRDLLRNLLIEADDHALRFSDDFPDPDKLLAAASRMGLEGIVSKRRDQPYRSGPNSGWIKVKTEAWRKVNKDRWEMFEKQRRG